MPQRDPLHYDGRGSASPSDDDSSFGEEPLIATVLPRDHAAPPSAVPMFAIPIPRETVAVRPPPGAFEWAMFALSATALLVSLQTHRHLVTDNVQRRRR